MSLTGRCCDTSPGQKQDDRPVCALVRPNCTAIYTWSNGFPAGQDLKRHVNRAGDSWNKEGSDCTLPIGAAGPTWTWAAGPYCPGFRLTGRRRVGNGTAGSGGLAGAVSACRSGCDRAGVMRGSGASYGSASVLRAFLCMDKCLTRRRKRSWMYLRRCRMPRWNCFNPISFPIYIGNSCLRSITTGFTMSV